MSAPENPVESSQPRESGAVLHQRDTRHRIILPFLLAWLLIIGIVMIAATMNDPLARTRVSLIADFMILILVMCPAMLTLFVIYMLIIVMNYGMLKLHRATGTPLQRLENLTEKMAERVNNITGKANQQAMNLGTRFAPIAHFLSVFEDFDPDNENNNTDLKETPDGTTATH
ncbi:MAG: hypothetical protein ACPG7F_12380 [Aggregatilineales bacterium]